MKPPIDFLKWKYEAEARWVLETGLPFPDDGALIVVDEIAKRTGQTVQQTKLPVVFSHEEAVRIAKALGGDDKADDIRTAINSKAERIANDYRIDTDN